MSGFFCAEVMTEAQFFRRALALPIVVPVVAGLIDLGFLYSSVRNPFMNFVGEALFYISMAGLVSFPPYAIVAIVLDRHLARTARVDRRLLVLAPAAVATLTTLFVAAAAPELALIAFAFGCFVGYAYVALIAILEAILISRGAIARDR